MLCSSAAGPPRTEGWLLAGAAIRSHRPRSGSTHTEQSLSRTMSSRHRKTGRISSLLAEPCDEPTPVGASDSDAWFQQSSRARNILGRQCNVISGGPDGGVGIVDRAARSLRGDPLVGIELERWWRSALRSRSMLTLSELVSFEAEARQRAKLNAKPSMSLASERASKTGARGSHTVHGLTYMGLHMLNVSCSPRAKSSHSAWAKMGTCICSTCTRHLVREPRAHTMCMGQDGHAYAQRVHVI